jgi:hypothetical protein
MGQRGWVLGSLRGLMNLAARLRLATREVPAVRGFNSLDA